MSSWPWSGGDCEPGTGDGSGALNTDAVAALSHLARVINKRGVDVAKVMASGGITTPGTDVMRTQFSADKCTCWLSWPMTPDCRSRRMRTAWQRSSSQSMLGLTASNIAAA
jgi:hypothetical protein